MPQGKKYVRVPAEDDHPGKEDTTSDKLGRQQKGVLESCFDLVLKVQLTFLAALVSVVNYLLDLLSRSSYVFYVFCCGECALGNEEERRHKLAERRREQLKQYPGAPLAKDGNGRANPGKDRVVDVSAEHLLNSDGIRIIGVQGYIGVEEKRFNLSDLGETPVKREPHDPKTLRIGVLTWNLAESVPSEADVASVLTAFFTDTDGPWMVAVAAQECGPIAVNPFSGSGQKAASAMFGACGRLLAPHGLVPLAFESLGATCLGVFVHRSLFAKCSSVEPSTVACGAGGTLVNKGAVGIGFHLLGSRLCFISSHLAAHEHKVRSKHDSLTSRYEAQLIFEWCTFL
jgi:hypothetical protein